jgi:hypothetical protein
MDNTIVVAVIGAFTAIAVPIVLSYREQKTANQNRVMDLFQNFTKQLTELIEREGNLRTKSQCEAYAMNYLDTVDEIAFLYNSKKIGEITWYFEDHFRYGITIHKWMINHRIVEETKEEKDRWSDLLKISKFLWDEHLGVLPEDQLPYAMQKYASLKEM